MKKLLRRYVIWTYLVFYCSILVIGMIFNATKSEAILTLLKTIAAWIPTFVLVVMFRKIYPEGNLKDYVKRQFSERINMPVVLSILILYFVVFLGSLLFRSSTQNVQLSTLFNSSWISVLAVFGISVVSGAMGEEIGWRGFILTELQKRHSPLKAAIIVGVIWGFWHTLLWFVSGITGFRLVQYIISFLIVSIASSIITAAFYNMNRNLAIPMITHLLLNFLLSIQTGDIVQILTVSAVLYSMAAVVLVLVNYKNCLYGNKQNITEYNW